MIGLLGSLKNIEQLPENIFTLDRPIDQSWVSLGRFSSATSKLYNMVLQNWNAPVRHWNGTVATDKSDFIACHSLITAIPDQGIWQFVWF